METEELTVLTTEVDGLTVSLKIRPRKHSRFMTWRDYESKPRMYVDVPNETILDDLVNRASRPYTAWRKILKQAFAQLGFDETRINWSQRAGCSCPCSPGFILTDAPRLDGTFSYDIWATIEGAPTVIADDPVREARAVQLLRDPTIPL